MERPQANKHRNGVHAPDELWQVESSQITSQTMYALVHFPTIDVSDIDQFRMKYDPQFELIEPHITLMFPVADSISEDDLIHHIESVLKSWQPFPIRLQGLQLSSDDHLFLLVQEGKPNIVRFHDEIYTGIIADLQRKDIPFLPHLTLGVLDKDENMRAHVLEEAGYFEMDYSCVVDKVHLVKVNADRSGIIWRKEFPLAGQRA